MKRIMLYYAKCNQHINRAMYDVMAAKLPSAYGLRLEGYYFKTLGQILDHIFITDMVWTKAFLDVEAYGMDIVKELRPIPAYGDAVFKDLGEYHAERQRLDAFILEYIGRLEEPVFEKLVVRRTRDGTLIEKPVFKSMVHFFNHQTHHRGQISNVLDNLKIENNYSNMIFVDT